jgi:hypothetical protein
MMTPFAAKEGTTHHRSFDFVLLHIPLPMKQHDASGFFHDYAVRCDVDDGSVNRIHRTYQPYHDEGAGQVREHSPTQRGIEQNVQERVGGFEITNESQGFVIPLHNPVSDERWSRKEDSVCN